MTGLFRIILIVCASITSAQAQFSPALLRNESYWADGKAEFNIYAAELVRDGVPRTCEVLHILARETEPLPALRLNQIVTVPMGLIVQQQTLSSWWRLDTGALAKFCLTSSDSSSNRYQEARREGDHFVIEEHSPRSSGQRDLALPANGFFYSELPWLVRTIDFSKPSNEFEISLADEDFTFQTVKISYVAKERAVEVMVKQMSGVDRFTLDREGPHLLREWTAANGNHLKLKRNLKVDYWNYTKPGDRERALNNPMLRLPD